MKKILSSFALITASTFAQAELVVQDYEVDGDNGIVFDTETGNQWLTMSYTDGMVISDAINLHADKGWKLADFEAAETFINNAKDIARSTFTNMMGPTYQRYGLGLYLNPEGSGLDTAIWGDHYTTGLKYYGTPFQFDVQSHNMGVLLYRNVDDITDVSAPLLGIAGLTLLGMAGLRRRK